MFCYWYVANVERLYSGYSFPVPWHQIPCNIIFGLYTTYAFITDSHRHEVREYLATQFHIKLRTPIDLLRDRPKKLSIIVSTLPELDFPSVRPEHIYPCGPITLATSSIEESDPELKNWLAKGSTVYINLGSIYLLAENQALQLAKALREVLDYVTHDQTGMRMQVLWKLKKQGDYATIVPGCKMYDILGPEIEADQVRVIDWLLAEPLTILQTESILCSVHHGGANSYNEAVV